MSADDSLFRKRFDKFKHKKTGYYSFIFLCILYAASFFFPVLINNRALIVKHEGKYYFPAFRDLLLPFVNFPELQSAKFGQSELFGMPYSGPVNYRQLAQAFTGGSAGNYVLMPFYPFGPEENLLNEISTNPPTPPDTIHILGTDNQGRDVFSRLAYGFRISLTFGIICSFFSFAAGITAGGCLGYFGGKADLFGLRIIEIISGIPLLYMTMILISFLKPSFFLLCAVLVIMGGWIGISYYIRGEFYREKVKDYVLSAVSIGASDFKIMLKHILPNALTPVITFFPFALIGYISALVSLDFLGLGLPPPTPSWGELLGQGVSDIEYWWLVTFPLAAMFLTLLMITFIGESIRNAFDPKSYQRLR